MNDTPANPLPVRIVGALASLTALVLVVLIVLASLEQSLAAGLRDIVGGLWGVTTMVDLYAGLLLIAAWIAALEREPVRWIPWALALMCTGNLAAMVYLAWRSTRARTLRELLLLPRAEWTR